MFLIDVFLIDMFLIKNLAFVFNDKAIVQVLSKCAIYFQCQRSGTLFKALWIYIHTYKKAETFGTLLALFTPARI